MRSPLAFRIDVFWVPDVVSSCVCVWGEGGGLLDASLCDLGSMYFWVPDAVSFRVGGLLDSVSV